MLLSGSNNFVKAYEKRSSYVLGCYKVLSKRCGSHQRCSIKKGVLKEISQNAQGNICTRVSFLKKRLWHRCLPMNFVKFLRTPFLQNTTGRLFLHPKPCKTSLKGFQTLTIFKHLRCLTGF